MIRCEMQLDISGLRERVRVSKQMLVAGNRKAVHEASIDGADYARTNHRFQNRTGRLTGSELFARITVTNDQMTIGEIRNEVDYAWYVTEGTKPHRIWPKEGHGFVGPLKQGQGRRDLTDIGTHRVALRWYIGSQAVFAKYVDHPGTDADPYMQNAADYAGTRIAYHLNSVLVDLARYWAS